jgi:galactokinase
VDRVCAAFHAGDLTAAGAALRAGMRSLRDDFEVSTPEIDALCALADAQPGVYGSRLTGAGFGGCTVHLLEPAAVEPAIAAVREGFASRFGRVPPALATVLADGAGDLAL